MRLMVLHIYTSSLVPSLSDLHAVDIFGIQLSAFILCLDLNNLGVGQVMIIKIKENSNRTMITYETSLSGVSDGVLDQLFQFGEFALRKVLDRFTIILVDQSKFKS
jgi:hypothetical protein